MRIFAVELRTGTEKYAISPKIYELKMSSIPEGREFESHIPLDLFSSNITRVPTPFGPHISSKSLKKSEAHPILSKSNGCLANLLREFEI